ncbi:MAG: YraN family protein [Rickettsiales bacterium]|nr:MAG: YraN family protein [Rickettsiales bacterium]
MTFIKKQQAYNFGLLTEYYIICYLFFCGYRLVKHRYKSYFGEIDLLMQKGRTIIAVEVKARKNKDASLENSIHPNQLDRIVQSLDFFVSKNEKYNKWERRIDLVLVKGIFDIQYVKNCCG